MYDYPENDYRSYLQHSSKGIKWKNHKYIEIKNGRYIYPSTSNSSANAESGWEKWKILKDTENKVQPIYDHDEKIVSKTTRKVSKEQKKKTGEYTKDSISKKIKENKKLKNRVRRTLGLTISKIRRK